MAVRERTSGQAGTAGDRLETAMVPGLGGPRAEDLQVIASPVARRTVVGAMDRRGVMIDRLRRTEVTERVAVDRMEVTSRRMEGTEEIGEELFRMKAREVDPARRLRRPTTTMTTSGERESFMGALQHSFNLNYYFLT